MARRPGKWNYNTATDTFSRRDPSSHLLEVMAHIPDPADKGAYSGWRVIAGVDDHAEPPEIVALKLERGPLLRGELFRQMGLTKIETPDAVALTADLLRTVPLGALRHVVNTHLIARREVTGRLPNPVRQRVGSDRLYATWAAEYVRAAKHSRSPVADLADKFGEDRDRVRDLLHVARRRGLLSAGTPGTAGGKLTDKAIAVLRRGED